MDTIIITDLKVEAHVGVKEEERSVPQTLLINLRATADFSKAALSDDVQDTNNYATMTKLIKRIVSQTSYHLLEALGYHILRELFVSFSLQEATIRIEKPNRVMDTRSVGIEMSRKAEDFS